MPGDQKNTVTARILARFSRVTTSGKFISEIDGLRFIAIGTVVLFHLCVNLQFKSPITYAMPGQGNILTAIARNGFHGVELFFIISGFILAYPFASHYILAKPKVRLKQYFLRRITRLEPPYMLCMILFFFSSVFFKGGTSAVQFPHLAASLGYLHNVIYGGESTINNVAWSLEIEIQFYLLVPLLSLIFAIGNKFLRRLFIIALCVLSVTNAWLFIGPESRLYLSIVRFLHFFLIGFLLADVFIVSWREKPSRHWKWDLISLLGWPALFYIWNSPELSTALITAGQEPVLAAFFFPLGAFFLYCAVFRGTLSNRIMTNPWITTIGGMCYTIYLFHNQLIGLISALTKGLAPTNVYTVNVLFQGILILPLMLAATSIYFLAIERPCMRKDWPKQLMDKLSRLFFRTHPKFEAPMPKQT